MKQYLTSNGEVFNTLLYMRRAIYATSMPGNCFKQVFTDTGVVRSYSICIGNKYPHLQGNCLDETCGYRVFDRDVTFYKTPYKQVRKIKYTQRFRFLIVDMYSSYYHISCIGGLDNLYRDDMESIKTRFNLW